VPGSLEIRRREIMSTISEGLQAITARIGAAAAAAGRAPEDIQLVAVSKTFPPEYIRAAFAYGQRAFGESYVQEALEKINDLNDLPLEWHFIGPIQSNKTRAIAEAFQWAHSVDRLRIAQRLSDARPASLAPLQVCLQVNISGETSKSGVAPAEVALLAEEVSYLPNLRLRGLMTVPRLTDDPEAQRAAFRSMRRLLDRVRARGIALDTLSMGMSDDLEVAVQEGATIVRVGRAIFGERIASA
jgi:pyridoxal phosphate enzyme (YggS family)